MAQEPHNLYALILIYGGVLALILFSYMVASISFKFLVNYDKQHIYLQSLLLGLISLLIYSIFEISLYQVISLFPLFLFLVILMKSNSGTSCIAIVNKKRGYLETVPDLRSKGVMYAEADN